MTVLFSELLVPGWAQGPTAKIGLGDVTWAFEDAPVISPIPITAQTPHRFLVQKRVTRARLGISALIILSRQS